jgi:hypothetical protein
VPCAALAGPRGTDTALNPGTYRLLIWSAPSAGRKPRDDEDAADEWRAYRDVDDDLPKMAGLRGIRGVPPARIELAHAV